MLAFIIAITGLLIAVLLDWAIYTHLSAFLRVGLALDQRLSYRDLAISRWQKFRLFFVALAGAIGGIAFAIRNPELWVFAVVGFFVGHTLIYISIARK